MRTLLGNSVLQKYMMADHACTTALEAHQMLEMIDQTFVPKGDKLVDTISDDEEVEIMRRLLSHTVGLGPSDPISRSDLLQIVTNNDTATLAQICDYIDMDRKPTLS